jgi:hypothetical protein
MAGRPFLRCLGPPALFSPSGEPVRFRTKKHIALLVYLAVEPAKPHRRDRLAELLWPSVATAEARHSLATALSMLRPRLGPDALQTNREHVLLSKDRIQLDIERLEAGEVLGSESREALQVAGFLEGFDIPEAPEFTLWKDRRSASLLPYIKSGAGTAHRPVPPHGCYTSDRAVRGCHAGHRRAERGGHSGENGGPRVRG